MHDTMPPPADTNSPIQHSVVDEMKQKQHELLAKLALLDTLKEMNRIGSPEYKNRTQVLLDDAGLGTNSSLTPQSQTRKRRRSLSASATLPDSSDEAGEEELGQSRASEKASEKDRTIKRRLQRKASVELQIAKGKTVLYAEMENNEFKGVVVANSFISSTGKELKMWDVDDNGIWTCQICRSKTAGSKYDPEKDARLDSKLEHNRYREHTMKLSEMVSLPEGALNWVPWPKSEGHKTYSKALDAYKAMDPSERRGELSLHVLMCA